MTNLEALADIAAAISAEGHPASAKHLRDAAAEIVNLRAEKRNAPASLPAPAGDVPGEAQTQEGGR